MQFDHLNRREIISLLSGATVAWPLAARAQQGERVRRIGVLMGLAATDPDASRWVSAFEQALQNSGWSEGRNIKIEYPAAASRLAGNRLQLNRQRGPRTGGGT